jgi:hypothetical protein
MQQSVTEQPTYLPQQPIIQQPVVQSLPQPLVVQSGIVQPVAQQIFVQTAYIQQQQQQPIHQIQHIEQQTYIQSAQVIDQYVPAAYQLPQNVEQQQQAAYVQPAPAELVRKQSGLCQQQLEAAASAYLDSHQSVPVTQLDPHVVGVAVVDMQLQNPVLQAVASDSSSLVNRSGTPEPGAQCCCSDVYTTDSCGESSAAEFNDDFTVVCQSRVS